MEGSSPPDNTRSPWSRRKEIVNFWLRKFNLWSAPSKYVSFWQVFRLHHLRDLSSFPDHAIHSLFSFGDVQNYEFKIEYTDQDEVICSYLWGGHDEWVCAKGKCVLEVTRLAAIKSLSIILGNQMQDILRVSASENYVGIDEPALLLELRDQIGRYVFPPGFEPHFRQKLVTTMTDAVNPPIPPSFNERPKIDYGSVLDKELEKSALYLDVNNIVKLSDTQRETLLFKFWAKRRKSNDFPHVYNLINSRNIKEQNALSNFQFLFSMDRETRHKLLCKQVVSVSRHAVCVKLSFCFKGKDTSLLAWGKNVNTAQNKAAFQGMKLVLGDEELKMLCHITKTFFWGSINIDALKQKIEATMTARTAPSLSYSRPCYNDRPHLDEETPPEKRPKLDGSMPANGSSKRGALASGNRPGSPPTAIQEPLTAAADRPRPDNSQPSDTNSSPDVIFISSAESSPATSSSGTVNLQAKSSSEALSHVTNRGPAKQSNIPTLSNREVIPVSTSKPVGIVPPISKKSPLLHTPVTTKIHATSQLHGGTSSVKPSRKRFRPKRSKQKPVQLTLNQTLSSGALANKQMPDNSKKSATQHKRTSPPPAKSILAVQPFPESPPETPPQIQSAPQTPTSTSAAVLEPVAIAPSSLQSAEYPVPAIGLSPVLGEPLPSTSNRRMPDPASPPAWRLIPIAEFLKLPNRPAPRSALPGDEFSEFFSSSPDGTTKITSFAKPSVPPSQTKTTTKEKSRCPPVNRAPAAANKSLEAPCDPPFLPYDKLIGLHLADDGSKSLNILFQGRAEQGPVYECNKYVIAECRLSSGRSFTALGKSQEEARNKAAFKALNFLKQLDSHSDEFVDLELDIKPNCDRSC